MIINPKKIKLSDVVAVDLETTGLIPWLAKIVVVSITTDTETYVLDTRKYSKEFLTRLFRGLSEKLVVGQNIKFDSNFIYYHYGILFPRVWDTMLADQILTNGLPGLNYGLYEILSRSLRIHIEEDKKHLQMSFVGLKNEELTEAQYEYAGKDTRFLLDLYRWQYSRVKEDGLDQIMQLENKLLPVLVKMETSGCKIDVNSWNSTIIRWQTERVRYIDQLDWQLKVLSYDCSGLKKYNFERKRKIAVTYSLFDDPVSNVIESPDCFNYASSAQILELFKLLNEPIPSVKDKETGVIKNSAGEGVLRTYLTEYPNSKLKGFVTTLLQFREYEKLLSTYGDSFLERLDGNNYIHTSYSQCYTDTGRLSSLKPNLQNIPGGQNAGAVVREFFIPDDGHVMVTADMSGAEVRIAAAYSGEDKLIDSVIKDEDLHSKLASVSYSIIFGSPITISKSKQPVRVGDKEFVPQALRDKHKSVLFAKFYKGGAKRIYEILAEYINTFQPDTAKECSEKISKAIDKQLPKLSKYLSSLIDEAQRTGKLVANFLGRIRYFDKDVYGEAANYPIQASNADAMKLALVKLDEVLTNNNWGRLVMTVHDEVVCSIRKEFADVAAQFITATMAEELGRFLLGIIPGDSSVAISNHWQK